MKNLGDKIASVATPIAKAMKLPCVDPATNELRPDSPCAKAKQDLNMGIPIWDVFYERFWQTKSVDETPNQIESNTLMEYLVNKTTTEMIAVTADTMDEAEEKSARGEGQIISRNKTINARPKPDKPEARAVTQTNPLGGLGQK